MRLFLSGTRPELLSPGAYEYLGALTSPRTGTSEAFLRSTGLHVAADNDCFRRFDASAYQRLLDRVRAEPGLYTFVTAPDFVGNAYATIYAWHWWWPSLIGGGAGLDEPLPAAFVGQDGAESLDVDDILDTAESFFVGGTTAWKLSKAAADLIREAKRRGLWVHMGRVNTFRRFRIAYDAGCDSIDGSSFSKFPRQRIPMALRWLERLHRREPRGWAGELVQKELFA